MCQLRELEPYPIDEKVVVLRASPAQLAGPKGIDDARAVDSIESTRVDPLSICVALEESGWQGIDRCRRLTITGDHRTNDDDWVSIVPVGHEIDLAGRAVSQAVEPVVRQRRLRFFQTAGQFGTLGVYRRVRECALSQGRIGLAVREEIRRFTSLHLRRPGAYFRACVAFEQAERASAEYSAVEAQKLVIEAARGDLACCETGELTVHRKPGRIGKRSQQERQD